MGKIRKVYLPKWITWFTLAMIVPMWGWITYQSLFVGSAESDVGLAGWIVATVVLVLFAVLMVLMGKRKLPAYLLEIEDEEE